MPDTSPVSTRLLSVLLLIVPVPWLYFRSLYIPHSDILWLSEAAERVFAGDHMSDMAFETNPPLSLLLYSIPVLLKQYVGLPLQITTLLQTLVILVVSSSMLLRGLKSLNLLNEAQRFTVLTCFVLINTLGTGLLFGQRDHLIAMILPGFLLLQYSFFIARQKPSCADWAFLGVGSIILLLKPFYLLLPSVMIGLRISRQHRILAPDVLAIIVTSILYAAIILLAFPDYLSVILPDVMAHYYSAMFDTGVLMKCLGVALVAGLAAILAQNHPLTLVALGCGALCLLSVLLQGKGFYYHYIPAFTFIGCAVALQLHMWLDTELRNPTLVPVLCLSFMAILAYAVAPPLIDYPRTRDFKDSPIGTLIADANKDTEAGSFFMFVPDMSMTHHLAYATHLKHASRFVSLWFMADILDQEQKAGSLENFSTMMAEDLERYQPPIILIIAPGSYDTANRGKIDLIGLLKTSPEFADVWRNYTADGSIEYDEADYYGVVAENPGATILNIYRRK